METDTLEFVEMDIEIIPPEPQPRRCESRDTVLCPCCRRPFDGEPDEYGICQACIECP